MHDEYVAFVRSAKVGWWLTAAAIAGLALLAFHIPFAAVLAVSYTVTLGSCVFADRQVFSRILIGECTPAVTRNTIIACAAAAACLLVVLAAPKLAVAVWPWWLVPLSAASSAIVLNGWLQTRVDQVAKGYGVIAPFIAGQGFIRTHAGDFSYLLTGLPFLIAAWLRKTSGSLLASFLVYLICGEVLWIAARLGLGRR
jgi:hypothetical protein